MSEIAMYLRGLAQRDHAALERFRADLQVRRWGYYHYEASHPDLGTSAVGTTAAEACRRLEDVAVERAGALRPVIRPVILGGER